VSCGSRCGRASCSGWLIEHAVVAVGDGSLDELACRHAYEEAHRLAGSLAALGAAAGSESARALEARFLRFPPKTEGPELSTLVKTLRAALEAIGTQPPLGSAP
jgi:HPt (histidine-containing phosphotransfer) domain-containing protein